MKREIEIETFQRIIVFYQQSMDSCCINSSFAFSPPSRSLNLCVYVCVNAFNNPIFHFSLALVVGALTKNVAIRYLSMRRSSVTLMRLSVFILSPACRAGFYKSTLGNMECSKCPPHSFSHHEGSLHCGCEKNYFRAEGDPASMACTRKCRFYTTVSSTFWGHSIPRMRCQWHPDAMQVPSRPQRLLFFYQISERSPPVWCGRILTHKTCNETCLNLALKRNPLVWLSLTISVL